MMLHKGWGTLLSTVNDKFARAAGYAEGKVGKEAFPIVFESGCYRCEIPEFSSAINISVSHILVTNISLQFLVIIAESEMGKRELTLHNRPESGLLIPKQNGFYGAIALRNKPANCHEPRINVCTEMLENW